MKALKDVAEFLGYKDEYETLEEYEDEEDLVLMIEAEETYNNQCNNNSEAVRKRLLRRLVNDR